MHFTLENIGLIRFTYRVTLTNEVGWLFRSQNNTNIVCAWSLVITFLPFSPPLGN